MDKYFGNVCELDLIFNFDRAYQILDELFIAGELCEPSSLNVLKNLALQDEQLLGEIMDDAMLFK